MKSQYELGKHRFHELRHHCLQYPEWQAEYNKLDGWAKEFGKNEGDTTSKHGIKRADLARKMGMIRSVCQDVCEDYAQAVFEHVIFGIRPKLSKNQQDYWYYYYKFFWELDRRKG